MSLEFPMLTLAQQVSIDFGNQGLECADFYTTNLEITSDQATALCTGSKNFTFADPFLTSVALTNTYLYQGTFNKYYYEEFLTVSEIPVAGINDTFYGPAKGFTKYFDKQSAAIYDHYKGKECLSVNAVELNK